MLIRHVLPDWVVAAEMDPLTADPSALFPEERAEVARAVPKRAREFAAGRLLARQLFGELGMSSERAIPVAEGRAPLWPAGVVGSISHCHDLCAVALASRARSTGIGIDVEANRLLGRELRDLCLRPDEFGLPQSLWMLLFSAKESVYKALFPTMRQFLDFQDVSIRFEGEGTFRATLWRSAPPFRVGEHFPGRFFVGERHIATAVVLEKAVLSPT